MFHTCEKFCETRKCELGFKKYFQSLLVFLQAVNGAGVLDSVMFFTVYLLEMATALQPTTIGKVTENLQSFYHLVHKKFQKTLHFLCSRMLISRIFLLFLFLYVLQWMSEEYVFENHQLSGVIFCRDYAKLRKGFLLLCCGIDAVVCTECANCCSKR